ncbi:MAG: hypothetical protein IKV98_06390 [Clostridia bacterium]|nr:hypothetical protein [Clostridia bacterium]
MALAISTESNFFIILSSFLSMALLYSGEVSVAMEMKAAGGRPLFERTKQEKRRAVFHRSFLILKKLARNKIFKVLLKLLRKLEQNFYYWVLF